MPIHKLSGIQNTHISKYKMIDFINGFEKVKCKIYGIEYLPVVANDTVDLLP